MKKIYVLPLSLIFLMTGYAETQQSCPDTVVIEEMADNSDDLTESQIAQSSTTNQPPKRSKARTKEQKKKDQEKKQKQKLQKQKQQLREQKKQEREEQRQQQLRMQQRGRADQ